MQCYVGMQKVSNGRKMLSFGKLFFVPYYTNTSHFNIEEVEMRKNTTKNITTSTCWRLLRR